MLHSLSRALHEEVRFDGEKTTGVDWISHPSLRHADAPAKIDVVLVNGDPNANRPDLPHYGAGEAACRPTAAAVANAGRLGEAGSTGEKLFILRLEECVLLAAREPAGEGGLGAAIAAR